MFSKGFVKSRDSVVKSQKVSNMSYMKNSKENPHDTDCFFKHKILFRRVYNIARIEENAGSHSIFFFSDDVLKGLLPQALEKSEFPCTKVNCSPGYKFPIKASLVLSTNCKGSHKTAVRYNSLKQEISQKLNCCLEKA